MDYGERRNGRRQAKAVCSPVEPTFGVQFAVRVVFCAIETGESQVAPGIHELREDGHLDPQKIVA